MRVQSREREIPHEMGIVRSYSGKLGACAQKGMLITDKDLSDRVYDTKRQLVMLLASC